MTKLRWIVNLLFLPLLSACGSGFEANRDIGSLLKFYEVSDSMKFIPESDQVVSSCPQNGDACIYLKNPVFQSQSLMGPADDSGLLSRQNFSVNLTGVDRSGFLKNDLFDVLSVQGEHLDLRVVVSGKGLSDSDRNFISGYYWLNRAHEYLVKNFSTHPGVGRNIKIYIDDVFDGWMWSKQSLHLNKVKKSALSADVILQLYGEAEVGFATDGKIYQYQSAQHRECGVDPVGCCKTSLGCAKALVHGSGDYFVNMLFPDAPGVGEFYAQNLNGQTVCGKARRPTAFKDLTATQVFSLCGANTGDSLATGLLYASIWWEVRSKFDAKTVDGLFLKHLSLLSNTDTLATVKALIKDLATREGHAAVASGFDAEFLRRGL